MTDYIIVASSTKFELEIHIKTYLKKGWKLQGGVSYDSNRKEFIQAVAK